jgi:ABC-2 type transport system permease protein
MNQLRSEWLKLWTTRTTWVMLGIALLGEALFAGLYVGLTSIEEIEGPVAEPEGLETVATGVGLMLVMLLVLGVLIATTEFRHGTASSTFLASPKRYPVLLAKLGVALAIGLVAGIAYVVVNAGLAMPLFSDRGGDLPATGDLIEIYGGVTVSYAVICAFGLGVGAVVRNQVGAIIAAIAFFFVLSPLPELLPGSIGEYFPAQAIGSLHGNPEGDGNLDQVAGGLVLSAWAAALVALGTLLVCRRDVAE